MKIRKSAVAGRFYPGNPAELSSQLAEILKKESPDIDFSLAQKKIIGAVVPHAGYMFSAYQAIHFFEILKQSDQQFDTFFIVNPNHSGYGEDISLDVNDSWETPYGNVTIDKDYHNLLPFSEAEGAHKYEHSGEVMLPLLQFSLGYDFKIVPVTLSLQNRSNAEKIADAIIQANKKLGKKICLIASSDFSHYVDPEEGRMLDAHVIDEILSLNPAGVYQQVQDKNLTVCGFGPIMTLMYYALKTTEKPAATILRKGHSGEVIESSEVVDYVSILFYEK